MISICCFLLSICYNQLNQPNLGLEMLSNLKRRYTTTSSLQFAGRKKELSWLSCLTDDYLDGKTGFKVVSLYGMAGIGKTALLKQYATSIMPAYMSDKVSMVYLDVGAKGQSPLSCLNGIFKQLDSNAPLYEYALARLYEDTGLVTKSDLDSGVYDDARFFKALALSSIAQPRSTTPLSLFEVVLNTKAAPYLYWYENDYADVFAIIDKMTDFELQACLPCLLGMSVYNKSKQGRKFVFVYDGYEDIQHGAYFEGGSFPADWWLEEFVSAAEVGLHIISGRRTVDWLSDNDKWEGYITNHHIDLLSDSDAAEILEAADVDVTVVCSEMSKLPLYLSKVTANAPLNIPSVKGPIKFADNLLSHMTTPEKNAVVSCALLDGFDECLFLKVAQSFGFNSPPPYYVSTNPYFDTECDADGECFFRVNAVIAKGFRFDMPEGLASNVLGVTLWHCKELLNACATKDALSAFLRSLHVLAYSKEPISEYHHNDILSLGVQLIESGYWHSILSMITDLPRFEGKAPYLPSARFLIALCLRKSGRLDEALVVYEELLTDLGALGEWRTMIQYYYGHCLQMLNKHDDALSMYFHILNQEKTVKKAIPKKSMLLARRQIAELSAIRGDFIYALSEVDQLLSERGSPIDKIKLLRLKGDIYRYNLMFCAAYDIYEFALIEAVKNDLKAMQIRLLVNLAESSCWRYPDTALKHIGYATDINDVTNMPCQNIRLHVAKTLSIYSKRHIKDASDLCMNIANMKLGAKCASATMFASQAMLIINSNPGCELHSNLLQEMQSHISTVQGGYQFILDTALLLSSGCTQTHKAKLSQKYQWLDYRQTANSIEFITKARLKSIKDK